jgi:hypothetical protein
MRLSVSSRQKPEVTPGVPFKNKIQHYQLKQSVLITPYIAAEAEVVSSDNLVIAERTTMVLNI